MGGDEFEHIVSGDLERVLLDNGEEDFQVVSSGQDRVGATPGRDEPEVVVEQVVTEPDLDTGLAQRPAGKLWDESGHAGLPFPRPFSGGMSENDRAQDHLHILALLETLSESAGTRPGSKR